jgi:hypothetical protein
MTIDATTPSSPRRTIGMLVGVLVVAVLMLWAAGIAGDSGAVARAQTIDPNGGLELVWGTGAAPRLVPASTSTTATVPDGGQSAAALEWGTGGPPRLVPLTAR